MKKFFLLMASALMIGTFAISCNNEVNPEKPDEGKEDPVPVEKSKACKILAFSLTDGTTVVEGEIFDAQKIIELQYKPEEAAIVANGTAEVSISEKATISPNPETISDWTVERKLTVTAEDGETSNEYTVKTLPIEYDVACAPSASDGKLLTAMGANNDIAFYGGNEIAFSGPKNIVTCDRRVYDLGLNYVGELNWGDILPTASMMSMGNDDKGVLIVAVGYGDGDFTAAPTDGDGNFTWNFTNATRFYAWPDGWDKAPVLFYENASCLMYMNVSGDFTGRMLIAAKQGGNGSTGFPSAGNHHLFHFNAGSIIDGTWAWFQTGRAEIDRDREVPAWSVDKDGNHQRMNHVPALWRLGQTAGSTVSPLGVTKEDALFVYAQALNSLSEEPEANFDRNHLNADEPTWGKDGSAGMIVAARQGYTGNDMILRGTAESINGGTKRYGGLYGWGNVCITGDVKAFQYSGHVYAVVGGSNWNETHITIVDVTASTPDNTVALIASNSDNKGAMPGGGLVSVAYVYDAEADAGHIVMLSAYGGSEKEASSCLRRYDLTREKK
ncbi:MAG: DUF5018 domain-containing protein [Bacteroidales bacterium]|nr:DUF5018 domain-containing protein [Bacteroidales bacterium]